MANVYHANYRSTDPRPSRQSNSIRFAAVSDAAAEAVCAVLSTMISGQLTSLYKRIGGVYIPVGGSAPAGTRLTANVIMSDNVFNVWRQNVRNVTVGLAGEAEAAMAALFAGTAFIGSVVNITALAAPPVLPDSGNAVSVINKVAINTKY